MAQAEQTKGRATLPDESDRPTGLKCETRQEAGFAGSLGRAHNFAPLGCFLPQSLDGKGDGR